MLTLSRKRLRPWRQVADSPARRPAHDGRLSSGASPRPGRCGRTSVAGADIGSHTSGTEVNDDRSGRGGRAGVDPRRRRSPHAARRRRTARRSRAPGWALSPRGGPAPPACSASRRGGCSRRDDVRRRSAASWRHTCSATTSRWGPSSMRPRRCSPPAQRCRDGPAGSTRCSWCCARPNPSSQRPSPIYPSTSATNCEGRCSSAARPCVGCSAT